MFTFTFAFIGCSYSAAYSESIYGRARRIRCFSA